MSAWQPIEIVAPSDLSALVEGLSPLVDTANTALDLVDTGLEAVEFLFQAGINPLAAAANVALTQFEIFGEAFFGAGFYRLALHPWTPLVGQGEGAMKSLSAPNAIRRAALKLADEADENRPPFNSPIPCQMVALLIGSPSPALFKQSLEAFNAFIGSKELDLAIRRIEQALRLEEDRFKTLQSPLMPMWRRDSLRELSSVVQELHQGFRETVALLKSYAQAGDTVISQARQLLAIKQNQFQTFRDQLKTVLSLLAAGFSRSGVLGLRVDDALGVAALIDALQSATDAPGSEFSMTALMVWVSLPGGLNSWAELMGL